MRIEKARRRFLAAMGLPLAALALSCAADPAPPPDPPEAPPAASPPKTQENPLPATGKADRLPHASSCPSGEFCVDAPRSPPRHAAEEDPRCEESPRNPDPSRRDLPTRFNAQQTALARETNPAACCYTWVMPCGGGRALRNRAGALISTPLGSALGWTGPARPVAPDPAAAARWARQAADEHASVASFARTTLELLALGAPANLVADTQAAGLDEVRHAQALFGLARAYGAPVAAPGPLAVDRPLATEALDFALATFEDACLGETLGALAAQADADEAEDAEVAAILREIAQDEERHAALAWATLAWALPRAGAAGHRALQARVDALAAQVSAGALPVTASEGHRPPGARAALERRALAEVVLPCARALLASFGHGPGVGGSPTADDPLPRPQSGLEAVPMRGQVGPVA